MLLQKLASLLFSSKPKRKNTTAHLSLEILDPRLAMTMYYIDPVMGSDTNPGTSTSQPYRTPLNLSFSTSAGNPSYKQLKAGDVVYLRDGVHDWSNLLQQTSENAAFLIQNAQGTAAAPIVIQAYPGERPIIKAREAGIANSALYVLNSSYVKILGLEVTGTYGPGIRVAIANEVELAHNYVHDVDGNQDNNIAGIYTSDTRGLQIHHNLLHDNYDRARASIPGDDVPRWNSRNVVIFGDNSERVVVHHNKVFNTPRPDGRETGAGIWVKHSSVLPQGTFEFYDNIVRDVQFSAIGSKSANAYMHHNLIVNGAAFLTDGDQDRNPNGELIDTVVGKHRLEFNTFVGSGAYNLIGGRGQYPATGFLSFQNNIVVDDAPQYTEDHGILRIDPYGDNAGYQKATSAGNLRFNRNIYFNSNPGVEPRWNIFGAEVADNGNPANLGGIWSFAQWQQLGVDLDSRVVNPLLNASFRPGNSLAVNSGWLAGVAPRLTLFVPNDTFLESRGANAASLTIVRSGQNLALPLTVNLRTTDATELKLPASVTIPAGQNSITVPIMAVDDNRNEPTRAVQIFATANYMGQALEGSEWVRVLQDSLPPPTVPQISIGSVSIAEGNAGTKDLAFTISLSAASSQPVSFRATTRSGSAMEGVDYVGKNQVLTILVGQRTATFAVSIVGDARFETNEDFTVTISEISGALAGNAVTVGTIVNDEAKLPATVEKPGVVRNGHDWYLDTAGDGYLAEGVLGFGLPGDRYFSGDMNRDGKEEMVVARENRNRGGIDWYFDLNGDGNLGERVVQFGLLGDIPLIGDFNADLRDDLAVGRWNAGRGTYDWYLDTAGDGNLAEKIIAYGLAGDQFVAGDFNGDQRDELIAVRKNLATGGLTWYFDLLGNGGAAEQTLQYGLIGDVPVIGDYSSNRFGEEIAVVRSNQVRGGLDWYFDLLGNGVNEELILEFGLLGDMPVSGKWRL